MKKRELIAIVLLLLSGLFITCSEKEELNPVETENYNGHPVGVSEAFIPLEEEDVTITNYNASGNVSLTYTGAEPKFIENKSVIVVDLDTMGYLRKVVSVHKQGNTINLTTEQAYFSDVFKSISFKLSTKSYVPNTSLNKTSNNAEISKALTDENGFIHPVKVVYHSHLGKATTQGVFSTESISESFRVIDIYEDFSNTDLYGEQGDNVHFYISEGYALFQSDAVFDFESEYTGEFDEDTKIKKSELTKFEFYLDSKAEFLAKLNLDMQDDYSKDGNPKIFDMQKITLKFLVGPVPVWITMDCDIYGKYTLSSDAKVNVDWGFKSTHELKIGGIYTKATDDFTPISEYEPTNEIYPMNIEGEINANVRFEIYPRAEVLFYGFFGPYAEVVPFVEGNYNATYQSFNNNFLAWNSNIDLGLDMRVGLELTFLWGLFDKTFADKTVNCFNTTLWAAPYDLILLSNIPASSEANSLIELKYKVIDKLGNPVLATPIHFSGDGTTSSAMVITNIGGEATVSWNVGNTIGEQKLTATIYKANGTRIKKLNHSTVVATNSNSFPISGLVSYYAFEDNFIDSKGSHDGTPHGGVGFIDSKISKAASFDGIDDYVEMAFNPLGNIGGGDYSFNLWFKPNDVTNSQYFLELGEDVIGTSDEFTNFGLFDYKLRGQAYFRYGNEIILLDGAVKDLTWQMASFVREQNNWKIYLNGELVSSGTHSGIFSNEYFNKLMVIGASTHPNSSVYFGGLIDELGIWNKVLSDQEIQHLYNNGDGITF